VIVVSAAILVFSPPAAAFTSSPPAVAASPGLNVSPPEPENGIKEITQPAPVDGTLQGNGTTPGESGLIVDAKGDGPTTIKLEPLLTAGVPETAVKPVVPPKPAAPAKPVAKPAPAVKPAPVVKPAAPAPEPKKERHDYWVQVGSYSTRERADGAKLTLGDKGLSAIVTNQLVNGETRYRVRVGPYDTKNEADYWLAMIQNIDSFKDSLVWESQSYR